MRFLSALLLLATLAGCQDSGRSPAAGSGPNPALARQLNAQAYSLILQGKYDQAEPLLRQAIDADAGYGPAHNNLGLVYFHQLVDYAAGDHFSHHAEPPRASPSDAAREFQEAIRLMHNQAEPRNNLGLVLEAAGRLGDAIDSYRRAYKMESDNYEYLGNLVRAKMTRGDRDEEMHQLLEEVSYKDPRPQWRGQARLDLLRLFSKPNDSSRQPTTMPSATRPQ